MDRKGTMGLTDTAKRYGLTKVYKYLEKNPRENLPKIMDFVDKVTPGDLMKSQRDTFRRVVNDPDNNWNQMLCNLWDTVDGHIIQQAFNNFILRKRCARSINATSRGQSCLTRRAHATSIASDAGQANTAIA